MIRLYRRWRRHRREMAALDRVVAILKEQDAHFLKTWEQLERLRLETLAEAAQRSVDAQEGSGG
jgi:hypothetical protein